MADNGNDPFREFDARMARVAPERQPKGEEHEKPEAGSAHMGMHVGVELVAGVIGGALLGYGVDYVFGTAPFGLLILLLLGSAAGMLNAYRYIQRLDAVDVGDQTNRPPTKTGRSSDEEGDTGGQST